jgi:hypothetical protein
VPKPIPVPVRQKLFESAARGESAASLAAAFRLPVRTVRHLRRRFRERGADAVRPDYHAPDPGVWSRVVFGDFQAAGLSLMPSLKTVPLTTSTSSGDPFNVRQPLDAPSISLNTIVRHATRLPLPLVLS